MVDLENQQKMPPYGTHLLFVHLELVHYQPQCLQPLQGWHLYFPQQPGPNPKNPIKSLSNQLPQNCIPYHFSNIQPESQ